MKMKIKQKKMSISNRGNFIQRKTKNKKDYHNIKSKTVQNYYDYSINNFNFPEFPKSNKTFKFLSES